MAGDGCDIVDISGFNHADTQYLIKGNSFADSIIGSNGTDIIYGGKGNDTISGGSEAGADSIYGDLGNDILVMSTNVASYIEGGMVMMLLLKQILLRHKTKGTQSLAALGRIL